MTNKYAQMSDYEINKRVFTALTGAKPLGYPHNADGRSVGNETNGEYVWYDYCNNVQDAWPLIIKNKICLAFDVFAEAHDGGDWVAAPSYGWSSDRVRDNNPLRAAMIVFLMMMEEKVS